MKEEDGMPKVGDGFGELGVRPEKDIPAARRRASADPAKGECPWALAYVTFLLCSFRDDLDTLLKVREAEIRTDVGAWATAPYRAGTRGAWSPSSH